MSDVTHCNTPSLWETLAYAITLTFFKRKKPCLLCMCEPNVHQHFSVKGLWDLFSPLFSLQLRKKKKKKSQLQLNSSQPVNKTKNKLLHAHLQPCHKYCVKSDVPLGMWVLHQFLQPHPLQHQSIYSTSGWRGESRGGEREERGGEMMFENNWVGRTERKQEGGGGINGSNVWNYNLVLSTHRFFSPGAQCSSQFAICYSPLSVSLITGLLW